MPAIYDKQHTIEYLQDDMARVEDQIYMLTMRLRGLEQSADELESRHADLRDRCDAAEAEWQNAIEACNEVESEILELEQRQTDLEQDLTEAILMPEGEYNAN